MNRKSILPVCLCLGLALVAFAPRAQADAWDKKTIATFSQSIEIPGKVIPPGTYVFKLLDSPSNRHIVRIMNEREDQVVATILAIPSYRMDPPEKVLFTFYEMPSGQPEVLKEWFWPGDNYGQEFAYSKKRHTEILAAIRDGNRTETQVASVTPLTTATEVPAEEAAPSTLETANAVALPAPLTTEAEKLESPAEPVQSAEPPAPAPAPDPAPEEQSPSDTAMPKTASQLALIGMLGGIAALSALGVRHYRNTGSR